MLLATTTALLLGVTQPIAEVAMKLPPRVIRVPAGQPAYTASLSRKGVLTIRLRRFTDHLMGARIRMGEGVAKVVLDHGVYSDWTVQGTKGADELHLAEQATVITKKRGGVFNMGRDAEPDVFRLDNRISYSHCMATHDNQAHLCHPLKHLQRVTLTNFGREDVAIIQGKRYGFGDLQGNAFRGIAVEKLRVVPQGAGKKRGG